MTSVTPVTELREVVPMTPNDAAGGGAELVVDGLVKAFGPSRAVDGVSFEIEKGECLALLGPSGCGKTTTLRCVAGLEDPTHGRVAIGGRDVWSPQGAHVPTEHRGLGMMFQSYALWPHMTVAKNVGYPLRARRRAKREVSERVEWALGIVGLAHRATAYPGELSGGQQQRVALARSFVADPALLLFDEPLSNLDRALREEMRTEIRRLMLRIGATSVYVTHDQAEAFTVADRIAIMRDGRIEQLGSADEVYRHPVNRSVATFVGQANFLPASVISSANGVATVRELGSGVGIEGLRASELLEPGVEAAVMFRPEDVTLLPGGTDPAPYVADGALHLPLEVTSVAYLGSSIDVEVRRGDQTFRVSAHHRAQRSPDVPLDQTGGCVVGRIHRDDLSVMR